MSRCKSVRIATTLPTCALLFPVIFAMYSNSSLFRFLRQGIYTGWLTIGNLSSPDWQLTLTGSNLSSLLTTTAHCFTFASNLHLFPINSVFARLLYMFLQPFGCFLYPYELIRKLGGALICGMPRPFDHSLATYPFRDGAPFLLPM